MTSYSQCDKCGQFGFADTHKCKLFFAQVNHWTGTKKLTCWGKDHCHAVEHLVELMDADAHELLRGSKKIDVHIIAAADENREDAALWWQHYVVEAEAFIEYSANRVEGNQ